MTDNGCKREMTLEEELLAFDARLKELLFAEDEYPGDSLLKSVLRDSKRILSKVTAKIEALQMDNKQLQSDVITANQNYKHIKELRENALELAHRTNKRFLEAKKELQEAKAELESLRAFKSYFDELYGTGLDVANWHENGALEPFDSFYDSAVEEMERES